MKETVHYFNGNFVPKRLINLSIDDVGILRGYAVFDFFKAVGKVPLFLEDHLDRLENSAAKLNLTLPISRGELASTIKELIARNQFEYSSFKIIVTGGESTDGFSPGKSQIIILNNPFADPAPKLYEDGISLMLHKYHRDFPEVKSTYYAQALSLQKQWLTDGHTDVLYHDGALVSEVSRSNVFFFDGDLLRTNQVGVLSGVTRKNVLKCAKSLFKIKIAPIGLEELLGAEEVFITSSTKKIMPVVKLDDRHIGNGLVGERTKGLMKSFEDYIDQYVSERTGA
ncbi:aminotransferase class IV [Roseivirga sp. E12]|uniref:aminotransferase class IV n=1 Tax=Roseivirga sp. E12 TaxID=2819237 RepID=UPI001ABBFA16|nr:aminotransferase class IV [Roseivirga sp. E12]MBO3699151.1 aminotransferase class IV family protein [Roseivirga sp. E12]